MWYMFFPLVLPFSFFLFFVHVRRIGGGGGFRFSSCGGKESQTKRFLRRRRDLSPLLFHGPSVPSVLLWRIVSSDLRCFFFYFVSSFCCFFLLRFFLFFFGFLMARPLSTLVGLVSALVPRRVAGYTTVGCKARKVQWRRAEQRRRAKLALLCWNAFSSAFILSFPSLYRLLLFGAMASHGGPPRPFFSFPLPLSWGGSFGIQAGKRKETKAATPTRRVTPTLCPHRRRGRRWPPIISPSHDRLPSPLGTPFFRFPTPSGLGSIQRWFGGPSLKQMQQRRFRRMGRAAGGPPTGGGGGGALVIALIVQRKRHLILTGGLL